MGNVIFWLIAGGALIVVILCIFNERLEFRTRETVEKCRNALWQKELFNLGTMTLTKEVFARILPKLPADEYGKLKQDLIFRRTVLREEGESSDKQQGVICCIDSLLELMHDYETERAGIH